MEIGSISKWNLKEGDKFEAGTAIADVETDKATVTYEGTEDGYIAKILVGTGEVKVGAMGWRCPCAAGRGTDAAALPIIFFEHRWASR